MQGGINNAGLFGASQREARSKLDQMAGIKRPSGILASSPELMRAAAGPAMMQPPPQQPMPMPTNMPVVQPALQAMPMPTTVAPMAQAPAPRSLNPMAQAPAGQKPVVKLAEGGEPFRPRFQGDVPATAEIDITIEPLKFIQDMDKKTGGAVTEQFGSIEAAAKEGTRKANIIETATAATKDPSKVSDAVLVAAGEQPTDAAKMDFAENVFGLKDVNDIDEINRRIANVAIGGSVAKSPEEFTQAVLLGLQAYKQTATARAEAKADAGGFLDTERGKAAVELYIERIKNNEDPVEVERMMNEQMGNNIGTVVRVAIAGGTGGGAAPSAQSDQGLKKGQTATGPNGQKIQWDGTSWQKVQ
jgi:hypothetical protein